MPRNYKYPFLYDENWWKEQQNRSNLDIGREFDCPPSTVRLARKRMNIPPLSGKWLTKKQWESIEFRKKRSEFPQLYDKFFWKNKEHKTNSEIAKELNCNVSIVITARKFLGIKILTPSEAQKRRYERNGYPKKRIEITNEMRENILKRANNKCQILSCSISGEDILQIDHIKDMQLFENPLDANFEENLIVLCKWHHKWWGKYKKEHPNYFANLENPYKESIELIKKLFPKI